MNTEMFIIRAKEIHRDETGNPLYDYTKSVYVKSAQKLVITCKKHGDFEQTPNSHLSKHGCKKCASTLKGQKLMNKHEEFIKECEKKHPNKLDFSKTKYINSSTPIIFICKECKNEFKRDPTHMLRKDGCHGCSYCNGGIKDNLENFIRKAKLKHNELYNYELVEYINSQQKVKIKCNNGHIFEQAPNKHLAGDGCPLCIGRNFTTSDFISRSQSIYGNRFNYSKAKFKDMRTRLLLICELGHEFAALPCVHLRKGSNGGCTECAKIIIKQTNGYNREKWIELALKIHKKFYDYTKVIYISSQENIIIICPKHGEFEQTPAQHLSGRGCRDCGIEKSAASKLYTDIDLQSILLECKMKHDDKYEYKGIYREDGELYVKILCKHGEFKQRLDHHRKGHGCWKCSMKTVRYSKVQMEWLNYLSVTSEYIQHAKNGGEYQIPDTNMFADGYDPITNTILEFQGDFWHGNPARYKGDDINPRTGTTYASLYEKTQRKNTKLKELGYNVYEMWESDWDKGKNAVIALQRVWKSKQ